MTEPHSIQMARNGANNNKNQNQLDVSESTCVAAVRIIKSFTFLESGKFEEEKYAWALSIRLFHFNFHCSAYSAIPPSIFKSLPLSKMAPVSETLAFDINAINWYEASRIATEMNAIIWNERGIIQCPKLCVPLCQPNVLPIQHPWIRKIRKSTRRILSSIQRPYIDRIWVWRHSLQRSVWNLSLPSFPFVAAKNKKKKNIRKMSDISMDFNAMDFWMKLFRHRVRILTAIFTRICWFRATCRWVGTNLNQKLFLMLNGSSAHDLTNAIWCIETDSNYLYCLASE